MTDFAQARAAVKEWMQDHAKDHDDLAVGSARLAAFVASAVRRDRDEQEAKRAAARELVADVQDLTKRVREVFEKTGATVR